MQTVLYPLIKVTQGFSRLFTGASQLPAVTEEEIVAMIRLGGKAGELTPAEQQLLSAVFQFDELVCRQIMVPRRDAQWLDVSWSVSQVIDEARRSQHTRYPLCRGSFDDVVGLIHMKDLVGVSQEAQIELESIARPLRSVPETMPVSRLLREMQSTHQHMAVVVDEFGTAVGIVTLENVIEQIVGSVQDEFDREMPEIVPEQPRVYLVQGNLALDRVNRGLHLNLDSADADTLSGLLVSKVGRLLRVGDEVELEGAQAEVVEVQAGRATRVRMRLNTGADDDDAHAMPRDV
jgi:CBS domain containing-hemolysin-like protein